MLPIIVKITTFKTRSHSLQLSEKDPFTRCALCRSLKNGVCQRCFAEGILFFW